MLQLKQQLSRSSPSLALQNLPAGLHISVQGTTDPLSKQPSLVLQPEGTAREMELARGGQEHKLTPQGTSSEHQVDLDCALAQRCRSFGSPQYRLSTQHHLALAVHQHAILSGPWGPSTCSSQHKSCIG